MNNSARLQALLVGSSFLLAASCGPGTAAKAVRGDAPTAGSALGGQCGDEPAPWVIDLPDATANQLEGEMSRGEVVLVNYNCESFKVVRGCKVRGAASYAYGGLEGDAKSIEMADSDSLALNLSGGPAFAAKMSSEMERGNVFRIDFLPAGAMTTTTDVIDRGMLSGDKEKCASATHFVSSINLGAYQLSSGAAADIGAAAEVFGQGVNAKSSSKVKNQLRGGDASACKGAGRDDREAPKGCRNLLFVQLFPIEPGGSPGAPPPPRSKRPPPPPPGVFVPRCPPDSSPAENGKCVKKSGNTAFACGGGDFTECRVQCDRGNAPSCARVGFMYEKGEGVKEDLMAARSAYQKACDKNEVEGCTGLGYLYSKDSDPNLQSKSVGILEKACSKGSGRACSGLGQQARIRRDFESALKSFERGCSLGYTRGCFYAGNALVRLDRDDARQVSFFKRACFGGDERGCLAAGSMLVNGSGGAKDPQEGARLVGIGLGVLEKECDKNKYESCEILADFYLGKYGKVTPKPDKATPLYDKACRGGQEDSCNDLGQMYESGNFGAKRDPARSREYYGLACDKGFAAACSKVGKKAPATGPGPSTSPGSGPSGPPKPKKPYCNDRGQPIMALKPGQSCP